MWRLPRRDEPGWPVLTWSSHISFVKQPVAILHEMCKLNRDHDMHRGNGEGHHHVLPRTVWLCDDSGQKVRQVDWAVLRVSSDIWNQMSQHSMRETKLDECIKIVGCNADTVQALADMLYLGFVDGNYADADARALFGVARYYGLRGVCEWLLSKGIGKLDRLIMALRTADSPSSSDEDPANAQAIRNACMAVVHSWSVDNILGLPVGCFAGFEVPLMYQLVQDVVAQIPNGADPTDKDATAARHERAFCLVDKWYNHNMPLVEDAHGKACTLLNAMDLKKMRVEFLLSRVQPSTLLPTGFPASVRIQTNICHNRSLDFEMLDVSVFATGEHVRQLVDNVLHITTFQIGMIIGERWFTDTELVLHHLAVFLDGQPLKIRHRLRGDIGHFLSNEDSITADLLLNDEILARAGLPDAQAVLRRFAHADRISRPHFNVDSPILTPAQCASVIQLIDQLMPAEGLATVSNGDFVAKVPLVQMQDMLGAETMSAIATTFANFGKARLNLNAVMVRCTECRGGGADGQKRHCIDFHTDESKRTMQIVLNGQDEYQGGSVVYVIYDRFLSMPRRIPGSYSIHDWNMVHGVTPIVRGKRYALYFLLEGQA